MNFTLKKSETIYHGKVFDLQRDELVYNSGNEGIREVAIHPGGAVAIALTRDYKIILVEQFRYPLQKFTLELPAGKLNPGEDPSACAARELEEETGYKAGKLIRLGAIATTPGFCTELLHVYLAEDLTPGNQQLEEGEYGLQIKSYTIKDIENMISEGEIFDAKTISGIYLAKLHIFNRDSR